MKKMHPFMMLMLNEKIVASTWVGEILAIKTEGAKTKRQFVRGKSVDEVIKRNANGLNPKLSYHFRVRATFEKLPIA